MDRTNEGLTPAAFFARRIEGALMIDAQKATGVAYSTIHRVSKGESVAGDTLTTLARWSIENAAAKQAGVYISLDAMVADALARTGLDADEPVPADTLRDPPRPSAAPLARAS